MTTSDATITDTLPELAAAQLSRKPAVRIAFSFIGGAHHFWHAIPVAAALSHMADVVITCFVVDVEDAAIMAASAGLGPSRFTAR